MTTKQRFRTKRLEVRERDHAPAHAHLVGGSVDIVIDLPTLETTGRWPPGLKAEVLAWVAKHRDALLED